MKVNIKKLHPNAVVPKYAKAGDAGMDLYATEQGEADKYGNMVYKTGLAMEIPDGHVGLIYPRSSVSKTPHMLRNHVGVIDSGYRGNIIAAFNCSRANKYTATLFQRLVQICPPDLSYPIEIVIVKDQQELGVTERGGGGFGSTGS